MDGRHPRLKSVGVLGYILQTLLGGHVRGSEELLCSWLSLAHSLESTGCGKWESVTVQILCLLLNGVICSFAVRFVTVS